MKPFWKDDSDSKIADADKFWDMAEKIMLGSEASNRVREADKKAGSKKVVDEAVKYFNSVPVYACPAPEVDVKYEKYDIKSTPIQTNRSKVKIPTALEMTRVSEKALKELIIEAIKEAAAKGKRRIVWTGRIPSEAFKGDLRKAGYFVDEGVDRIWISW